MSDILLHVHVTQEAIATYELTPPHAQRVETSTYRKAHHFLIIERDSPCSVCGVRTSTLNDTQQNLLGSTVLETHHYPIERSLITACDPKKVHLQFPQVYDDITLMQFVDSPSNLLVLCDICHRSKERGIHHLLVQDWAIQPFLKTGYQVVATASNFVQIEAQDEVIEQQSTLP